MTWKKTWRFQICQFSLALFFNGYSQHYDHFLLLRYIYNEELATCSRPTNRRLDLNVVSVLYRWRQLQAVHANFILMNNAAHIMMFFGHAKLRAY